MAQRDPKAAEAELERAEREGIGIRTPADSDYPARLLELHAPPLALYVQGRLTAADADSLAVVGTRRPTVYGRDCAERLGYQLCRSGLTVVSGLARGIDAQAHRGALKAGGRTIAVVGSGLDRVYPPEHGELAAEIAEHGAVISEFAFGREPDRATFPARNRIISGLALGVVVVESGLRSGALITVARALEQGKTVFAVPGRIDSPVSRGPHRLLREGARLVEDVEDVLDELEHVLSAPLRQREAALPGKRPELSEPEAELVALLREGEMDVDELVRKSKLEAREVVSLLLGLEMKRMVRMHPGRMVELRSGRG
jgi:DNA processing protein